MHRSTFYVLGSAFVIGTGIFLWRSQIPSSTDTATTASVGAPIPATKVVESKTPVATTANTVASDNFERLLYLHYQEARGAALLNHDGAVPKKTSIVVAGDSLLGGTVRSVSPEAVLVDHPDLGVVKIDYLGMENAAAPIQKPFDARHDAIPVVHPPSHNPEMANALAAEQAVYAEARHNKGQGPGTGGGRGDGSGGGKSKRKKRSPQADDTE